MAREKSMRRWVILSAATASVGALAGGQTWAANAVWTGATSNAWEDASNWTPAGAPGAVGTPSADVATFAGTAAANITPIIDAGRNLGGITFDAAAPAYVIGTAAGNGISLSDGGAIQKTAASTLVQTVNAPLTFLGTGATAYAFTNNAATAAATNRIVFGGAIGGTAGTPTLTLNGGNGVVAPNAGDATTASNTVAGIVGNGTATSLALVKAGAGSWVLSGANTYTGGTSVQAGVLQLRNNVAAGTGAINVAAGAQLQFGQNGLNIPNNVTLNGTATGGALVGGIDGNANATTLSGTLTLAATSNVGSYWSDKSLTLAGKVTGPGGLTVDRFAAGNGSPNVFLTNAANDYAGTTTINDGSVLIFSANTIPNNIVFGTTSTLRWSTGNTQDISAKLPTIASGVTAVLDTNGNNTAAFASPINGAGAINKVGAGTLSIGATATSGYTGGTTVSAGVLAVESLADGNSNVGTGNVNLVGGTLRYTGAADATVGSRQILVNNTTGGTIDVPTAGRTLTVNTAIPGNVGSSLVKTGPGTLVLGGTADDDSLVLNVQAGTVLLGKNGANTSRAVAGISGIAAGATVRLTGTGTDQIYGDNANPTAHSLVQMTGGTLDLNGKSEGFARLGGTGVVTNGAAGASTLTIGEANGTGSTFSGSIQNGTGVVSLTKVGTGVQTLGGANTYTGATTISNGTLRIAAPLPVAGAAIWLDAADANSVTLATGKVATWADKSGNGRNATQGTAANQPGYAANATVNGRNVVQFAGTGQYMPANLAFLNGSAYTIFALEGKTAVQPVAPNASGYFIGTQTAATNQGLHFGYRVDNSFALAQYGNDIDYANASITFGGTQVFREWTGRLDTTAGTGGHATFLNGSQVASSTSVAPLTNPGPGAIGTGFNNTTQYAGDLAEIIIYPSALSATERAAVDAYLQKKWFGVGTNLNALPAGTALSIGATGTLDLAGYDQTVGSLTGPAGASVTLGIGKFTVGDASSSTFAGNISGTGSLLKMGAGKLTLNGANALTGTTTVAQGTLGGGGGVAGPLSIVAGGTLAPGNSVGTFASGDLSVASSGTLAIELDPTNSAGNGTADLLNVTGTVNLTGGTLSLALLSQPTVGQQFTIIANNLADAVTGTFASGASITSGVNVFSINYAGGDGNDVVLTTTSVPEPAALGTLCLAAIGLLGRRRKRQARVA